MKLINGKSLDTYRLWYNILRNFVKPEDCESDVVKDFSGVWTSGFEKWIESVGDKLFSKHRDYKDSPVRYLCDGETLDQINRDTHFVLVIDRTKHPALLKQQVDRYLNYETTEDKAAYVNDGKLSTKKGTTKWNDRIEFMPPKRPLDKDVTPDIIDAITTDFMIYRCWHDLTVRGQRMTHPELGNVIEQQYPEQFFTTCQEPEDVGKRVSYHMGRATKIIAGLKRGKFPTY